MLFFSVSFHQEILELSSLRRGIADPLCVVFVRGTAVDGALFAGQDGDRQTQQGNNQAHIRGGSS